MEYEMSVFARFFRRKEARPESPVTAIERARLANTMPGETGARAGQRFGFLLN